MSGCSPENNVGVLNKALYYSPTLGGSAREINIADTLHLDRAAVEMKKKEGTDPALWNTFLIGGCRMSESVMAMASFITQIKPGKPAQLLVADLNRESLDLLKQNWPIEIPGQISIQMFLGDLTDMGLADQSVDYIKLDFTQGFIPITRQVRLFEELYRIVTGNGIVASVLEVIPGSQDMEEQKRRSQSAFKGSQVDTSKLSEFGTCELALTEEFIMDLAAKTGFRVRFFDDEVQMYYSFRSDNEQSLYDNRFGRTNLVVFEKQART